MRTQIDFLGKRYIAMTLSGILILGSIATMWTFGLNYGIDFVGGTELVVKTTSDADIGDIRRVVEDLDIGEVLIQRFGEATHSEFLIRLEGYEGEEEATDAVLRVKEEVRTAGFQDDGTAPFPLDSAPVSSQEDAPPPAPVEEPAAAQDFGTELGGAMGVGAKVMDALRDKLDTAREEGKFDLNSLQASGLAVHLEEILEDPELAEAAASRIVKYRRESAGGIFSEWSQLDQIEGLDPSIRPFLEQNAFLGTFVQIKAEVVGPTIGKELRAKALLAIFWSLLGILAYVWVRFELRFSVASIVALVHDVIIVVGILSLLGEEFSLPMVAAMLTIVGYSLNDTIVVFDRVRENLRVHRGTPEEEVINGSINQTLSRTLLTSGTTLLVVLALLALGGPVIHGFAMAWMLGVVVGTYSSIYVASPVVIYWRKLKPAKA